MSGQVIISGFADEAAIDKTLDQQFAVFAALGLQYFSIRFVDIGDGSGIQNVMELTDSQLESVRSKMKAYGLRVSSLGSPIGKVKLHDVDDGTNNRFVPFESYLVRDVNRACELANLFESKLIRGFSFYHAKGAQPEEHLAEVVDRLGRIADVCAGHNLVFGLEVEANLVGQSGTLLAEIHRQVNRENLVLIFDGGNLVTQGYTTDEVFQQYCAMKPGLGWIHVKDYLNPVPEQRTDYVDEEALKNYVPADIGQSGYASIFEDLKGFLSELESRMLSLGVEGVFVDLEPHVKGGGQFGGISGPDGFGVAMRGLCRVLESAGMSFHLRDFGDIKSPNPN